MINKIYDVIRYRSHDKFKQRLIFEYWPIIEKIKKEKLIILEIGIDQGYSLKYWEHYFRHPDTRIIGIDINIPKEKYSKKVTMHQCDQNDRNGLLKIAEKYGPFNIIIDDGSHLKKETENCFKVLWDYVVPGGHYIIEDWIPWAGEVIKYISKNKTYLKIADEKIILKETKHLLDSYISISIPGNAIAFYKKQL